MLDVNPLGEDIGEMLPHVSQDKPPFFRNAFLESRLKLMLALQMSELITS